MCYYKVQPPLLLTAVDGAGSAQFESAFVIALKQLGLATFRSPPTLRKASWGVPGAV